MILSISTDTVSVKLTSSVLDHYKLSSYNDVKFVIVSLTSTPPQSIIWLSMHLHTQDVNDSQIWSTTLSSVINLPSIKTSQIIISLRKKWSFQKIKQVHLQKTQV